MKGKVTRMTAEQSTGPRGHTIARRRTDAHSLRTVDSLADDDRGPGPRWPLYVANVYLGTHRDSFGQLYQKIREERGYNYAAACCRVLRVIRAELRPA